MISQHIRQIDPQLSAVIQQGMLNLALQEGTEMVIRLEGKDLDLRAGTLERAEEINRSFDEWVRNSQLGEKE